MKKKIILIGIILAVSLGGWFLYRFIYLKGDSRKNSEKNEIIQKEEADGHKETDGRGEPGRVKMTPEMQKQNGVAVSVAKKQRLGGVISVTGKVEANADRIAHVSPRISGKIVDVKASLGDSVSAGQALAILDSVELGEALNRYHQSNTRFTLAQASMERVRDLVEKKIAARKDILQAETDFKTAQIELHTDEDRLSMYGVSISDLKEEEHKKPLLPVSTPISGIITEKHAIVGELSDPSKSLYTVSDLSSVWVIVDINEKDLARIHKGQTAVVNINAFPDLKPKGRITYIADLVNEATRTIKARIEVANPGRKLKPEMFATVELALSADTPVLAVPEDSLQYLDGNNIIFVAAKNKTEFEARQVELGRSVHGLIEIVSGLRAGELYAAKGSFILKSELKKGEMGGD